MDSGRPPPRAGCSADDARGRAGHRQAALPLARRRGADARGAARDRRPLRALPDARRGQPRAGAPAEVRAGRRGDVRHRARLRRAGGRERDDAGLTAEDGDLLRPRFSLPSTVWTSLLARLRTKWRAATERRGPGGERRASLGSRLMVDIINGAVDTFERPLETSKTVSTTSRAPSSGSPTSAGCCARCTCSSGGHADQGSSGTRSMPPSSSGRGRLPGALFRMRAKTSRACILRGRAPRRRQQSPSRRAGAVRVDRRMRPPAQKTIGGCRCPAMFG